MAIRYEKTTCSRCHGSGHYSRCERYGTTCFGCAGSGEQLSKAGAKANEAVKAWKDERLGRAARDLAVGDRIWMEAGMFTRARWATVTGIRETLPGRSITNGVAREIPMVIVETNHGGWGMALDHRVRVAGTAQDTADLRAFARTLPGVVEVTEG